MTTKRRERVGYYKRQTLPFTHEGTSRILHLVLNQGHPASVYVRRLKRNSLTSVILIETQVKIRLPRV